jgi:hypothetical protein
MKEGEGNCMLSNGSVGVLGSAVFSADASRDMAEAFRL